MNRLLIILAWIAIICAASAHAQGGIPATACNTPASVRLGNAGTANLIANAGDQTLLLCSVTVQVTQGLAASDYQLLACKDISCSTSYPITPLLPGHASQFDTYNLPANPTAQIVLRKGYGLYITLSGAGVAVAQAIYGAY